MRPSPLLALSLLVVFPGAGATPVATVHEEVLVGDVPATEDASCSGNAPLLAICTTGAYVGDGTFSMGMSARNYRGTLENRLDWPSGSFVFRCRIAGAVAQCTVSGSPPSSNTLLVHDCRSLDSTTGALGGSGQWTCTYNP